MWSLEAGWPRPFFGGFPRIFSPHAGSLFFLRSSDIHFYTLLVVPDHALLLYLSNLFTGCLNCTVVINKVVTKKIYLIKNLSKKGSFDISKLMIHQNEN
jgi:hypothetical protein